MPRAGLAHPRKCDPERSAAKSKDLRLSPLAIRSAQRFMPDDHPPADRILIESRVKPQAHLSLTNQMT